METQTKQLLKYLILPLVLAAIVVFVADARARPDYLMHVNFYDVGQGDAMMIQTYTGKQIVIDGGPSDAVIKELGNDMPFWDRSIDLLILTHPDADHISGFVDIIKRYQVKKILLTGVKADTAVSSEFFQLLKKKQIEKIYAHTGQRLWLDQATVFDVYYPPVGIADQNLATNDTSINGKLSFGNTQIFFTGDASDKVENWLVASGFNLDSDILKVGHHGSRFSSTSQFLEEITPEYSVIEVGKNNYGHPTKDALDRIAAAGSKIFRTDQDGSIEFISDGFSLYKK